MREIWVEKGYLAFSKGVFRPADLSFIAQGFGNDYFGGGPGRQPSGD